jgi:hypothetical protein
VRRLLPLLALALLAAGCGDERPSEVTGAGDSLGAAPTVQPTQAAGASSRALAGFGLDVGYAEENGDDHSPVLVTDRPGLHRLDYCGHLVWDPATGTTDLIGVEFRGEAEWSRGRTLALYPSEAAAADAVDTAHDAVAACSEESGEEGYGTTHDLVDTSLGDRSVVWADTYWSSSEGERLHDTGLTVYHLVRVGRAVLGSYEYGEGNGSAEGREREIAGATDETRPVVTAMSELSGSGGSPA